MKLLLHSLAEQDLQAGMEFYERQQRGLGTYFSDSLLADIESLRLYAGVHRKIFGYHRLLARRFPYAVFYEVTSEEIRIWRVLDCRRNPRWSEQQIRRPRRS